MAPASRYVAGPKLEAWLAADKLGRALCERMSTMPEQLRRTLEAIIKKRVLFSTTHQGAQRR